VANGVIDASAIIELFTGKNPGKELRKRVILGDLVAPQLFDLEAAQVLRKLVLRGNLAEIDAHDTLRDIKDSPISRCDHRPLLERVWELRKAITAYDAAYVALAEQFGVPLITCDSRLAGANGHKATIEKYELST
jgi:predicted nucleic acid-binding protein